ncbi:hypothetical protein C2845_PM13G23460 [Panicum miliaceum]|uniref:Malic enzyme n=1 Tax=Panicum miliaceum TaxID=4540 RepID=A0A3L6RL89_PANMI|nr:hypothetical protein C2845_PM13G23460 [Panicum miliaceum]
MRSLFQACYHYRRLASFPRAAEAASSVRAYCWKQFEANGYEPWRRYISTSTSKVLPWEASSRETLLRKIDSAMKDGNVEEALQSFGNYKKLHGLPEPQVLINNIEYAPIVYTPTVGLVCQNYSGLFRRPRGMYFSSEDQGEMMSMVYNWPADQVDMIVVTDGSRILGLGDLGVQGIGIAIGKLDLYVAAAGINPQRVLPVMIDVERTMGSSLRILFIYNTYSIYLSVKFLALFSHTHHMKQYDLGLQEHRLEGDEYVSVIDEFMEAVFTRWPNVIVQFEDFQSKWAFRLLQRYRKTYRMFNDDAQGIAGVAIAGLLGAVRAQGRPMIDFPKQRIVVAGAGSAGIGVVNAASRTMARMLGNNEVAFESASSQFWIVDAHKTLADIDPDARPFARRKGELGHQGLSEGASLVEVPLMILTGDGKIGHSNQGNNMYLFPGIGLGTLLSGARAISDGMLQAAAERIRDITKEVAAAVVREAVAEDLAEGYREMDARELARLSEVVKLSTSPAKYILVTTYYFVDY